MLTPEHLIFLSEEGTEAIVTPLSLRRVLHVQRSQALGVTIERAEVTFARADVGDTCIYTYDVINGLQTLVDAKPFMARLLQYVDAHGEPDPSRLWPTEGGPGIGASRS